jgi:nucleoside-diphosphate-sugar epimerase
VYQHAGHGAAAFIRAARVGDDGASIYNLGGSAASMAEITTAIAAAAPDLAGRITFEAQQLPNPTDVDSRALDRALGPIGWTPLAEGVRQTIEHFRAAADAGRLDVDRAIA